MPASQGIAAFGTFLKIGDGQVSESFATIAEVTNIDWGGFKVNLADVTNHSSPNAYKEIVPTTIDPGQVKFTVNFTPLAITQGSNTGLMRDAGNKTKRNFQLQLPFVIQPWTFSAYVTGFDMKAPVDGKLSADFTVDITGVPGFTQA